MKKRNLIMFAIVLAIVLVGGVWGYKYISSKNHVIYEEEVSNAENTLTPLENLNYFPESAEYKDVNGETVNIPKDFAVSTRKGENVISNGLVIVDKNLNEFVYIPNGKFFVSRFEIGANKYMIGEEINNILDVASKQNYLPISQISSLDNILKDTVYSVPTSSEYETVLNFAGVPFVKDKIETITPAKKTGIVLSDYTKNIANLNDNLYEFTKDGFVYGNNAKVKLDNTSLSYITTRLIVK